MIIAATLLSLAAGPAGVPAKPEPVQCRTTQRPSHAIPWRYDVIRICRTSAGWAQIDAGRNADVRYQNFTGSSPTRPY